MTKLISFPSLAAFVLKKWNVGGISFCVDLDQRRKTAFFFGKKLRIFLEKKLRIFLETKLLSRLVDSIRSKGETSGGNRDMLSGATKSLISLPLTEIHPDIFENVFLQWVHNAHSKIDKMSYSVQLIFRIYFKGWVEIFASCLP